MYSLGDSKDPFIDGCFGRQGACLKGFDEKPN